MSRLSSSSVKGCDSPSVTMEKGRYRMRAPSTLPLDSPYPLAKPTPRQPRGRNRDGISSFMAALVVLLSLACLASFGFAYYLFTTRWDPMMTPDLHHPADESIQVIPFNSFERSPREYLSSEKYISYLPHSGLHNQRIALENAIVLGALTNRTVLVPPIRLGNKPLRYVNSESLQHVLTLSGKTGLRHCSQLRSQFLPPECFDYFHYTHISPQWLFNLTSVDGSPPIVYPNDLSGLSIRHRLQLSVSDILTFRDSTPYHYRFLDTMSDTSPIKHKYTETIFIPDLARHPHRLIELGTLFGSSRLRLREQNNKRIRTRVRRAMEFSSPQLVSIADAIEKAFRGPYLGAHVRLGDGSFKSNGETTSRRVWRSLVHDILQFNVSETSHFERAFHVFPSNETDPSVANDFSRPRFPPSGFSSRNLRCRGHRHSSPGMDRLNSPLFISTDVRNPIADPTFSSFLRTFPCTFFLSDFTLHIQRLDKLQNEYDGTTMRPFLVPLLDAMVVGRAWAVAGTEGSTFSRFIQDVLWRRHHGLDIVERG
ncbi:hypothetical protein DFH07DRAFT_860711 [Mycena maculata]|uniref:O-fucosyltransferase family protein n=1 Tax=Mycena maculata TaxID=230809 RepID=A0AAD7MHQ2_9AGAR|nr:hypothetical protein DFH07DRAFT_860711 [Mycena maculata]